MTADAITAAMGGRVAEWLRREYPRDGAKRIARDLNASPHTARRWLEGALPENRAIVEMARRWGSPFLSFIYQPALSVAEVDTAADELSDLRRRLERLEGALEGTRLDRPPPGASRLATVQAAPAGEPLAPGPGGSAAAALAGSVDWPS